MEKKHADEVEKHSKQSVDDHSKGKKIESDSTLKLSESKIMESKIIKSAEKHVGIEEYITSFPGTGGILKEEPEFFKVTEIIKLPEFHEDGSNLIIKVKKVNWDTMNFARVLSNRLGISRKRIEFAGTKDKRALTTQHYSISKADNKIVEKIKEIKIRDVEVEIAGRARRPLRLGDLLGNLFEIKITDLDLEREEFYERINQIKSELYEKGIPNYFGPQRFGTVRYITHQVGLKILKREYEEAFWIYVAKPFEFEREEVRKIREELWESRDPKYGIRELPAYLRYERNLLQKLIERKNEEQALLSLPKTLKMMFTHAYQSWIFNRVLSTRIREFTSLKEIEILDYVDFVTYEHIEPYGAFPVNRNDVSLVGKNIRRIGFLVGKRRAFLALPVPGYRLDISKESWAFQKIMEFLEEDGMGLDDFKHEHREFSSSGGFRLAEMPFDFSALKVELNESGATFRFFLPRGCYATSFLREFMK